MHHADVVDVQHVSLGHIDPNILQGLYIFKLQGIHGIRDWGLMLIFLCEWEFYVLVILIVLVKHGVQMCGQNS